MITPSFNLTATEKVLPKLALDFTTGVLDGRVTFTRTTGASNPATYINSSGYVTVATNNQPRFDYDALTLACKGLLIEETRTNQLLYSEDFTNVLYTLNQATVSADATTSPDGTTNADKFVEGSGTVAPFIFQNSSVTSGVIYTQTVFAKAAERSVLQFAGSTGFLSSRCNFDLSTGFVGSNDTGGTASIADMGNGWYRCSLSVAATTTSASGRIAIAIVASSTSARFATYTGDGTSGLYIWGAQLEAGAFATSYIPTTTTALTRNADVATMTGTNFSDWFNASEGTFVADAVNVSSGTNPRLTQADDGTESNRVITLATDTAGRAIVNSGGVSRYDIAVNYSGSAVSVAARYKPTLYRVGVNATLGANGTSTGATPSANILRIGASTTAVVGVKTIQKITYFPQALTDAELQAFSK